MGSGVTLGIRKAARRKVLFLLPVARGTFCHGIVLGSVMDNSNEPLALEQLPPFPREHTAKPIQLLCRTLSVCWKVRAQEGND